MKKMLAFAAAFAMVAAAGAGFASGYQGYEDNSNDLDNFKTGAGSTNSNSVLMEEGMVITSSNTTSVNVKSSTKSNTGMNKISGFGNSLLSTGNAVAVSGLGIDAGGSLIEVAAASDDCECDGFYSVNEETGKDSTNTNEYAKLSNMVVAQADTTDINADVETKSNTGKNEIEGKVAYNTWNYDEEVSSLSKDELAESDSKKARRGKYSWSMWAESLDKDYYASSESTKEALFGENILQTGDAGSEEIVDVKVGDRVIRTIVGPLGQ